MSRPERSHWYPLPAVAQAIAGGEPWILAWSLQSTTSYRLLSRQCGVSERRLDELYRGSSVTKAELTALARAWNADVGDVMLTLPVATLVE